jgi:hypothetical protein
MKCLFKFLRTGLICFLATCFSVSAVNGQNKKLIVIDPLVSGETTTLISQPPLVKVLRLPDKGNPISLITTELKTAVYEEVHIYLLTKPGSIIFDEINILPENVSDYSSDFSQWKNLLNTGARIVFHSENLTSEPEGTEIINRITGFTGRTVLVEK